MVHADLSVALLLAATKRKTLGRTHSTPIFTLRYAQRETSTFFTQQRTRAEHSQRKSLHYPTSN